MLFNYWSCQDPESRAFTGAHSGTRWIRDPVPPCLPALRALTVLSFACHVAGPEHAFSEYMKGLSTARHYPWAWNEIGCLPYVCLALLTSETEVVRIIHLVKGCGGLGESCLKSNVSVGPEPWLRVFSYTCFYDLGKSWLCSKLQNVLSFLPNSI